jgi:hypothetical protein
MTNPRFSFVATSRNDDHGGDVLRRTQSFINRLAEQCERHQVPAELILVEWNPPEGRAPLTDVLGWPAGSEWFSARIVTVSRQLHLTHRHASRLGLFQMIGKNVGIRRALGDHVIATNIDIIFSDEMFEWLKQGDFRDGVLYRSDRWDIPNKIQLEPDLDVLLRRAGNEVIRRNRKEGTYVRRDGVFVNSTPNRFDDTFYNVMKGQLEEFRTLLTGEDRPSPEHLLTQLEHILSAELPRLRRNFFIPLLHTNGCGDFTMLSRRDWFRLRGYPEWHIFSWTIDSILLVQAHYNGMAIEELNENCIHYHIEHEYGSGWTPEGAGSLWARLDERRIPYMSFDQYTGLVYELEGNAERNVFTIYNGANWGLAGREVEARIVAAQGSPARPPVTVNSAPLTEDFFTDFKPVELGLTYEQAFRPVDGVQAVFRSGADATTELVVETRPERWSYAVEVDLSRVAENPGDSWLVISLVVEAGSIGLGVLDSGHRDFLEEKFFSGPHDEPQDVILFVEDLGRAGNLVFRNATKGGRPARFSIRQFRIFSDWGADEEFPMFGERPVAPANPDADAAEPATWPGLSAMRAGSPGAIVRVLAPRDAGSDGDPPDHQILVVTTAEHGAWGGVLDLPATAGAGKLTLDLHVIAGVAGIGVKSSITDDIVAEQRANEGVPFTRVHLDLADANGPGVLIVRNLSQTGPAKVLIHRLDII